MPFRSALVRQALRQRDVLRAEFEDYRMHAYLEAEEACRTKLVNRRGERVGVSAMSLFIGSARHANAYASEELIEWWETHPRPVFEVFEDQRAGEFVDPEPERLRGIIRRALTNGRADLAATPDLPEVEAIIAILEEA